MARRRRKARDESGEYGAKSRTSTSTKITRLRRTLRGIAAPPPLTKTDRFEKIITSVAGSNNRREPTILRQFSMPGYILAEAQNILKGKTDASNLELLPTVILMEIINHLEGNHQIMAALACKTLASVVEASEVRKIANITNYCYTMRGAWRLERKEDGSTDEDFFMLGYARPQPAKPAPDPRPMYWSPEYYTEYHAAMAQVAQLKELVFKVLGEGYAWCSLCEMFRLRDRKWWLDFAEHENPGMLKSKHTKTKVDLAITSWNTVLNASLIASGILHAWDVSGHCPAHALLRERMGKRVVEELPAPPKSAKKQGKAAAKTRCQKRKYQEIDTDDSDLEE